MDTSETYIKMCREAKEIQNYYHCNLKGKRGMRGDYGDFVFPIAYGSVIVISENHYGGEEIWLPRQDQLQEMLIDELNNFRHISYLFSSWLSAECWQSYQSTLMSFEQLWLAFVMLKKYNKGWINETWFDPIEKINWAVLGNEIVKNI